jgi:hypothetical protein
MPSGREYHTPKAFKAPTLDEEEVARMRGPPDLSELALEDADDSDEERAGAAKAEPVGAFPGTKDDYAGGSTYY